VPATDSTTTATFGFKVTDSLGGTTSASSATMTVSVTPDAGPSALASSVAVIENKTYTFKASDFGYSDSADLTSDPLGSITITSLPANGTLQYNGTALTSAAVSPGFLVTAANIGLLTYVPATNDTVGGSFSFKVADSLGGTTSATAAMTLKISADPGPIAGASTVPVTEDVTYTLKSSD